MSLPLHVGKYRVLDLLGQGSMGVVYLAEDPDIRRRVAIKTIRVGAGPGAAAQAQAAALQRFRTEAQAVGRLQHPGIVSVHEYGVDGDLAFIAMEYVDGRHLGQFLHESPVMADADVLSVMVQLLDALAHAHDQGVWHRDIKPSNLMVTRQGRLKVTDFGIARIDDQDLTQVGSVIGTPHYMAPEQYIGQAIDQRVDLWAAGVLFYQLLTGQRPFNGSPDTVMYQVLHVTPVPPSEVCAGRVLPIDDSVVMQALVRDPAGRYASAQLFKRALLARTPPGQVTDVISEQTIVRSRSEGPQPARTTLGSTPPLPTGWDESMLQTIEAALMPHLGPVTRVLVRRAARECVDVATLRTRLSTHLPDDATRQRFLGAPPVPGTGAGTGAGTGTSQRPPEAALATGGPAGASAGPASDAEQQRAVQVLAPVLGPIARVVVRRAAADTAGREAFIQRLLGHVADAPQRAAIEQALRRPL